MKAGVGLGGPAPGQEVEEDLPWPDYQFISVPICDP